MLFEEFRRINEHKIQILGFLPEHEAMIFAELARAYDKPVDESKGEYNIFRKMLDDWVKPTEPPRGPISISYLQNNELRNMKILKMIA